MSGATTARPDSDSRVTRILGPAVVSLAVLCSVGSVALWGPVRRLSDSPHVMSLPLVAALVVGAIVVSVLGALIIRHQPRNTIGWSFLVAGGGMGVANLLDQYVLLAFAPDSGGLPAATAALWVITWMPMTVVWVPVFAVLFLFPHGRALSWLWTVVWWVAIGAVSGQAVLAMVAPGPMMGDSLLNGPDDPLAVEALAPAASLLGSVLWAVTSICLGLAALSMVLRVRRTGGSDLAVAASTLIAAAAFHPVRRRVRSLVDRRFSRSRYDAMRTVGYFAHRLRDEVDVDVLVREINEVADRSLRPAQVWLWLAEEAR